MRIQPDRLNPILRVVFVFIACMISALLLTPYVWGQAPDKDKKKPKKETPGTVKVTVEIGGQIREIRGRHTAKFQEVRDVPEGFFVQKLKLHFDSPDSPYFLELSGREIRQRDQRFTLNVGRIGKFRSQFVWDQNPHSFGTGTSFLQRTAPGVYQVSPTLRASLQALTLSDMVRTPPNGPLSTLVRQSLLTAPTTEVRLRRDQAVFRQSYHPSENVELYAQFGWLRNRGTRPMSAGTFVRRAFPATPPPPNDIGGIWEGIGQEFLEPIDHRTTDFRVGAQFRGKRWSAGVEYYLSLFRNRISTLTFENPFRVTDDEGCVPPPVPPQPCGVTAINRFRQVRWQSDLTPNNDSHSITVWAKVDLTSRTQVRGLFSLAYLTQNDAFLPWTLNTAIVPIHWDALTPITTPTDVNQLPASSANAKLRNITQEYALVNRRENFRFQAQYRSQSQDNQTPTIVFPGYAAFGDSTWRSARTDFFNLPIENLDWDFRRQNVEAGFQWNVLPNLTWKVDYGWEGWNRKFRDVNRNNEHSIRNRLDFEYNFSKGRKLSEGEKTSGATQEARPKSSPILRLKFDYRYSNRRALVYNTQPLVFVANFAGSPVGGNTTAWIIQPPSATSPGTVLNLGVPTEFNLLRRYDQSDRIRNDARVTLELLNGPNTSFSVSYRYLGDEHDKNFYGLLFNRFSFVDAEFTHSFDNGNFIYANYSREVNRFRYRDLAHLLPAANPLIQGVFAQFPIANTWERTSRSSLDSFQFGVNVAPQEGKLQNWQFDLSYSLSFANDRIFTFNPFTVRPDSIIHAGANPYPDTIIRRHDVNVTVTRRINERFEIGARYWYEPYKQDDFSYNVLQPYAHGTLTSDTPKYLFQDARYGSYHTNVATFFLRYTF
jgi:hypothetical protein